MSFLCDSNYTWSNLGEIQHNFSKLKISASILFGSFPLSMSANKSHIILRREWNSFFMSNPIAFFDDCVTLCKSYKYPSVTMKLLSVSRTPKNVQEFGKLLSLAW